MTTTPYHNGKRQFQQSLAAWSLLHAELLRLIRSTATYRRRSAMRTAYRSRSRTRTRSRR